MTDATKETASVVTAVAGGVVSGISIWWWLAIGAILAACIAGTGLFLHHAGYAEGVADTNAKALIAQHAIETAAQSAVDKAETASRLADQARANLQMELDNANTQNAQNSQALNAAADHITGLDGLLQQYRNQAKIAPAAGRSVNPSPDWIGVFGQCVSRVESLAGSLRSSDDRLRKVGSDAAKWADQANGLIGYTGALKTAGVFDVDTPATSR